MAYDLLIKDALIVDGTGAPPFSGDVGISGGKVVDVGRLDGAAERLIRAGGLTLTPGFVDIHTHYDGQVSWDETLAPSSLNGVTSVAFGNCGVGFAPARRDPETHQRLIGLLEGVEDIPGTALTAGLTWEWETFPDYLDALDGRQFAVDVGAHLPHAALRAYVMGERGCDHAARPSDDEIAQMETATREALAAGALGFSTSRTFLHKDRDGANINTFTASRTELAAAARALKFAGAGVFQLVSDAYNTANPSLADSEMELIGELGRIAERPISFSLMQADACPQRYRQLLDRTARLNEEGVKVSYQVAPRAVGVILGFAISFNPFHRSPTFQAVKNENWDVARRRLAQAEVKAAIIGETRSDLADSPASQALRRPSIMFRMSDPVDYEPSFEQSLQAEAECLGKDPMSHVYDVLLEDGASRLIYMPFFNYSDGNLDAVYEMMDSSNALFGLSDAGAHCGFISDGSFPVTTLDLWRRGNRNGHRLPLERLVEGYTSRNARHVGWLDRGIIAPGYKADINLIDLDALQLPPPVAVRDLPADGLRLLQQPRGLRWTIKDGGVSFEDGLSTGLLSGRLLRGQQTAPRKI